ncbi:MAG: N-acetyl-gamma-glutamyl-phosphate reductase, partial [Clostridia bacterium]|nr:N-acetyl-gamma-glutamyl-phosphate reductase [Clostridia bacterium]
KKTTAQDLAELYRSHYAGSKFVSVGREDSGFISANALNGTNRMEILVSGNEEQVLLVSRFDNLGKGASGAAIQNMNLALGLDEWLGL